MSYTNTELVRHHLEVPFPIQSNVYDQAVILKGDGYITFFGGSVDEDSFVVKAVRGSILIRKTVTLNESTLVITGVPIVPGSVLLASDSSLGEVYTEGEDFVVDYGGGSLALKDGGSLTIGQDVTVWYQDYHTYITGSDYVVDLSSGAIKRVLSGDIGDGETVYLDYAPCFASYNDELMANAVVEANGLIEREVDAERQFGADPALQGAATYRALEIISRASAARELSSLNRSDKTALAWMKLADNYAAKSEQLVSSFRPPLNGPAAPVRS